MQLLTLPKLAALTGWPESRIRRLVKSGDLAHVPMKGIILLPSDAIDQFIRKNLIDPTASNAEA